MTSPVLRLAAVAVLGLVLAGPARPAAVASAWDWLQALWSGADAGCNIDPDGKPHCAPIAPQSDLGCGIDPNGNPRCAPIAPQADAGCNIDPNGNPRCAP